MNEDRLDNGTLLAVVIVAVVVMAGIAMLMFARAQPPPPTPGQQIGSGVGELVTGILGAVGV